MKEITLNGAKFKVAANTMEELKNEALGDKNGEMYKFLDKFNASEPDIFILDGFATKENLEIKEGANVVFIRRGVMPGREVLKAMIASRNSPELNAALASGCVGVAGSARIGAHCTVGGAGMILGHLDIADHVHISAASMVARSITKPGQYTGFFPIDDNAAWEKNAASLKHLHALRERVRQLEKKLAENGDNARLSG